MKFDMRLFLMIGFALTVLQAPSMAAEAEDKNPVQENTPVTEWIAAERKLVDTLPLANRETMYILRHKHGIIRTIGVARDEISGAVQSCGKENPEIKSDIDNRFSDWERAVLPLIKTAKKSLNREIKRTRGRSRI